MVGSNCNFANRSVTSSFGNLLYQIAVLYVINSRRISRTLEKSNEKPLKWFSLKKIKEFIKNLYLIEGYELRRLMKQLLGKGRRTSIEAAFIGDAKDRRSSGRPKTVRRISGAISERWIF